MGQGKSKPKNTPPLSLPPTEEHHTFMCTETSHREAFRIAAFGLNVGAFDDATLTAEEHFVTWDALGDVLPYLPLQRVPSTTEEHVEEYVD